MNPVLEELLDEFQPYITSDLAQYLTAVGEMFDELHLYVGLHDEELRWQDLLDPDACPAPALPYLAQYVGEVLPTGLNEAAQRQWIKDAPNQIRGTLASIAYAAQRSLTGSKLVAIYERTGGSGMPTPEDYLTVVTYTADTPRPEQVLKDLLTTVPADLVLVYTNSAGQIWSGVKGTSATWNTIKTTYANWGEVRAAQVGLPVWTRPRPIPIEPRA